MVTMVLAGGVSAWFPECYHLRKCTLTATYSLSLFLDQYDWLFDYLQW